MQLTPYNTGKLIDSIRQQAAAHIVKGLQQESEQMKFIGRSTPFNMDISLGWAKYRPYGFTDDPAEASDNLTDLDKATIEIEGSEHFLSDVDVEILLSVAADFNDNEYYTIAQPVEPTDEALTDLRDAAIAVILARLQQEPDHTLYLIPACEIRHTDGSFTDAVRWDASLGATVEYQIRLSCDDATFAQVCDVVDLSTDALILLAQRFQQPVHPAVGGTLDEALTEAANSFVDLYADAIAANGLDNKAVFDWWGENAYKWPNTQFEDLKQAIAERI